VTARASDSMFLCIDYVHVTNCFFAITIKGMQYSIGVLGGESDTSLGSLDRQFIGDINRKSSSSLPFLSARLTITFSAT